MSDPQRPRREFPEEEAPNTDRAEKEEQEHSGNLKLHEDYGMLKGKLEDLPTKWWVVRILLTVAGLVFLGLGAAANILASILRLLGYLPFPSATPC